MYESNGISSQPDDPSGSSGLRTGIGRRRLLKTTAGGAAGITLAGCTDTIGSIGGSSTGEETVTIGVLAPNPDSDFIGRSIVRGAQIAANEIGEINNKEVEIVVGDTNGSPLEGRRQYQRLILEEGADVTVGVFTSEVLENIIDEIAEQETIHLTSGAATTAVSRLVNQQYEDYKYHFRAGPLNAYDLGRLQITFLDEMAGDIGWNSVAVLAEDYKWTEGPWDVYQEQLAGTGVDVAMERRYPPATDDFSAMYDEAEATGADAVFTTMAHTGTDALLDWVVPEPRQFAFGGIHVPMQLPAYYDMVNGACRYAVGYTSATANSTRTEKTKPFVNAYQNAYNGSNPVYTGYHTYDAILAFKGAVDRAGTLDSEEVVPALEETSIPASAGTVEFYGRDHEFAHDLRFKPDDPDTVYFQWQEDDDGEGVQEIIWPRDRATAEYTPPSWL